MASLRSSLRRSCEIIGELPSEGNTANPTRRITEKIEALTRDCDHGKMVQALEAAENMQQQGICLTRNIAYCLLQQCGKTVDLEYGRRMQSLMLHNGLNSVAVLGNHIIRLFANNGSWIEANEAFHKISNSNAYTWSTIISANTKFGESKKALDLYNKMGSAGIECDKFVYIAALSACTLSCSFQCGRLFHEQIIINGMQSDLIICNTLLDMYAKCGNLVEACHVFQRIPNRSVVSWNSMVAGYAQNGEALLAIEAFDKMQEENMEPTDVTFLGVLKACARIGFVDVGRSIHNQIIGRGLQFEVSVANTLVDMYSKCGSLKEALKVFNKLWNRSIVSWGAMIAGMVQLGEGCMALLCFHKMQDESIKPTNAILISVLKACIITGEVLYGRLIHEQMIENGCPLDVLVWSALIDMYAKSGHLEEAAKTLNKLPSQDVVSWGAVIAGYAQHGEGLLALSCFEKMKERSIDPNNIIFLALLKACANIDAIEQGRLIHNWVLKSGLEPDAVMGSALINMYAKCWSLDESRKVFDELWDRDIISWNTMIAGYAQYGESFPAVELFEKMQKESIEPDEVTFASVLKACANAGAAEQGRLIHKEITKKGLELTAVIGNSLIDMYVKCGSLEEAQRVFNGMPNRDAMSWGAIIAGYGHHGEGVLTLECFEEMQRKSIKPDEVSYTSILILCSHVGLVEEGRWYFKSMSEQHGIMPTIAHCTCMVDLFGQAGYLHDAESLLQSTEPNLSGWMSLLSACRMHGHGELGK